MTLCCVAELEDDMSSEEFQQRGASDADEDSDEDSSADEEEEQPQQQEQPPQQKRPLSSRVKVVHARRPKPPLAPKQQQAKDPGAAPAKRSFLTLAVSARKHT